jgi:hypothetical protein
MNDRRAGSPSTVTNMRVDDHVVAVGQDTLDV